MDWVMGHAGAQKVPPLFPLLLYNGDARWSAAQTMAELVESAPSLGDYSIGFRYFKLAANEFSQEQLIGIGNIVSTLFFAESKPDMNLLIEQFVRVFEQSEDKQASSTLVNWFRQLAIHGYVKPEDYASLAEVYRSVEEVKGMLQSTFKTQQERWYQQGIEKGIEKGREEGIEQGIEQGIEVGIEKGREDAIRRTALAMFARGIEPVIIADVTGLSEDELNAILNSPPPEDETP
jgi:hypothetical protein